LERFELSYAPSASIAVRTRPPYPVAEWRSLAALALTDPAIPAARLEVERVAACFPQAQLFLDESADLAGLQSAARSADVLHIATHGRFRPDNPYFSMLQLADGWVDVRSLYRLPLAARLVVLSACESGAGGVGGGDEVIGVARGFLAAGARSLVASLWNVHDATTATLMADFYAALLNAAATGPAGALRLAQLRAARQEQHPFYWASFFVIGA
jgi:CHAT domain-containing protein